MSPKEGGSYLFFVMSMFVICGGELVSDILNSSRPQFRDSKIKFSRILSFSSDVKLSAVCACSRRICVATASCLCSSTGDWAGDDTSQPLSLARSQGICWISKLSLIGERSDYIVCGCSDISDCTFDLVIVDIASVSRATNGLIELPNRRLSTLYRDKSRSLSRSKGKLRFTTLVLAAAVWIQTFGGWNGAGLNFVIENYCFRMPSLGGEWGFGQVSWIDWVVRNWAWGRILTGRFESAAVRGLICGDGLREFW
jgi:hypothetical protein